MVFRLASCVENVNVREILIGMLAPVLEDPLTENSEGGGEAAAAQLALRMSKQAEPIVLEGSQAALESGGLVGHLLQHFQPGLARSEGAREGASEVLGRCGEEAVAKGVVESKLLAGVVAECEEPHAHGDGAGIGPALRVVSRALQCEEEEMTILTEVSVRPLHYTG